MTHTPDDDDDVNDDGEEMPARDRALMDALRTAIGAESVPSDLVSRCEGLLAWADVDSELAALLEPEPELAGTRGPGSSAAVLEFAVESGSCVVEVIPSDGVIHGQLLGRTATTVLARTATGDLEPGVVTASGAFEIRAPATGLIRLEFEFSDERRIHTDWFVI